MGRWESYLEVQLEDFGRREFRLKKWQMISFVEADSILACLCDEATAAFVDRTGWSDLQGRICPFEMVRRRR